MSHHPGRRMPRALIGAVTIALSAFGVVALGSPAMSAISTPQADAVIRDAGPVTITEARGGRYANLQAATTSDNILARGCNGGNVNRPKADATIKVTRVSDGEVVVSQFHQTSNNLLDLNAANATAPFSATWDTTDAEPGTYRITSTRNDRAKVGAANSQTCTPDSNVVESDFTVEYRPWQHSNFNDLLGHGKVRLNSNPGEYQYAVDGSTSPILNSTVTFFSSPTGLAALPADPAACASNPANCLPTVATTCDPSAGCTPRLVVINSRSTDDQLQGVFDLETGAFAAIAKTDGKQRLLVSAGTQLDGTISDLIAETAAGTEAATGADLLALLSTTVEIRGWHEDQFKVTEVGVLRGLQVTNAVAGPDVDSGISLKAPYTVNAGFITHTVAPFTFSESAGNPSKFTVKESPLVPNLPTLFSTSLGSLGSLNLTAPVPVPAPVSGITGSTLLVSGGPLVNVHGTYPDGTGSYNAGTGGVNGPNVDTSANAPSGLPVWVPGLDSGTVKQDGPIDFVGHVGLFLDLPTLCLLGTCLDTGSVLIGQGVSVFGDSPLPALGDLPLLWDTENPAAAQLNEITDNLALDLIANPAVAQVITTAFSLLGGGTPDLEAVTATLSDLETFTDLIEAVTGSAGLDEVDGLEEAVNDAGVVTEVVPLDEEETPAAASDPLAKFLEKLSAMFKKK